LGGGEVMSVSRKGFLLACFVRIACLDLSAIQIPPQSSRGTSDIYVASLPNL
jgi:hypothetical protein